MIAFSPNIRAIKKIIIFRSLNMTFEISAEALKEMIEFINIEKKLGKEVNAKEEVNFAKELADKKKYPRAEYVVAVMHLNGYGVPQNKEVAMKYLDKSSKHASYDIQLKIVIPCARRIQKDNDVS